MANETKAGGTGDTAAATAGSTAAGGQGSGTGQSTTGGSGSGEAGKAGEAGAGGKTGDAGASGSGGDQGGAAGKAGDTGGKAGTETGGKAGAGEQQSKVPEKYDLKVPDGDKGHVDAGVLKQLETVARAAGWSNEDAQAALEEHLAVVRTQAEAWAADTKADKDYGGDKLAETQRLAKKVIDRVRPEGHARRENFLGFMNRGGAGNHLEVVAFLADLGKLMGDDSPALGRSGNQGGDGGGAGKLYDHPDSQKLDKDTTRA